MRHDAETLRGAVALFEEGCGYALVAARLGVPRKTVRKWLYTYRALGEEALFVTTHRKYCHELKVQAARDIVEAGMTKAEVMARHGIASITALESWCRAYREGGPDALLPRPKGRPRKPESPVYASREEELEARVRELELELEIQKRINALADGLEPR
jgi:transposase-like protein